MIKALRIRNLATIEDLELQVDAGFSILTGETGAGKSIIIDALRLLLGDKSSADLVRTGRKEAFIEGVFDTAKSPVPLDDLPPGDEGQLLIQRQITEAGTGKAYINGVLVPVRRLKEIGPRLIDIYGQNDHVFLLHLENHLTYVDDFLGKPALLRDVAAAAQDLRHLIQEKRTLEAEEKAREQKLDFVSYQIREIESAAPRPGEDTELLREREILKNAEKIAGLVDRALDLAYLREDSLLPLLSRLQGTLAEIAVYDEGFRGFQAGLQEAAIVLKDVSDSLVRFKDQRAEAPDDAERLEERLSVLEKLKRKYGATLELVMDRLQALGREQTGLMTSQERLADLEKAINEKFTEYTSKAGELGSLRMAAGRELERLIEKEIAHLGMKKARFKIILTPTAPSLEVEGTIRDHGAEEAEFLISPNPGEELRPLRRIASGGELSRVMLALKSVDKEGGGPRTLIFDEIDAGIGGQTAEFIALKLRKLAARHQVICITHLPQIAASASHHFRVDKKVEKERTFTSARKLSQEDRVTEIAGLIAGRRLTEASIETAREMLDPERVRERTSP